MMNKMYATNIMTAVFFATVTNGDHVFQRFSIDTINMYT